MRDLVSLDLNPCCFFVFSNFPRVHAKRLTELAYVCTRVHKFHGKIVQTQVSKFCKNSLIFRAQDNPQISYRGPNFTSIYIATEYFHTNHQ